MSFGNFLKLFKEVENGKPEGLPMDEYMARVSKHISEQIEVGIRRYISVQGSEREKTLELLVSNLQKKNMELVDLLRGANLKIDVICNENFKLSKKISAIKEWLKDAQV